MFCTSVHLYEHTSKAGHIPACRGGHWPSAVKTIINNTPMQIRNPNGYEFASARSIFGGSFRGRPMAAPTAKYAPRSAP